MLESSCEVLLQKLLRRGRLGLAHVLYRLLAENSFSSVRALTAETWRKERPRELVSEAAWSRKCGLCSWTTAWQRWTHTWPGPFAKKPC